MPIKPLKPFLHCLFACAGLPSSRLASLGLQMFLVAGQASRPTRLAVHEQLQVKSQAYARPAVCARMLLGSCKSILAHRRPACPRLVGKSSWDPSDRPTHPAGQLPRRGPGPNVASPERSRDGNPTVHGKPHGKPWLSKHCVFYVRPREFARAQNN